MKSVPQRSDSLRIGAVLGFGHRMMLRKEGSFSTIGSVSVLRTKCERQVERAYLYHLKRLTHTGPNRDSKHIFQHKPQVVTTQIASGMRLAKVAWRK